MSLLGSKLLDWERDGVGGGTVAQLIEVLLHGARDQGLILTLVLSV